MDTGSPLRIQHTERKGCTERLNQNITIVHINPTTLYDNEAFDDSDQCSREGDDFSDGFEQRVEETDCESITTELSSIIVDTDVTSSPASVIKRGYQVGLEYDAWSSNSTLNNFIVDTDTDTSSPASVFRRGYQAGCKSHSCSANSSLNIFNINSDVTPASIHGRGYQAGLKSDFLSAESSLSKLTLTLTENARTSPDGASCPDSFKGSQRIHQEEDQEHYHQDDKLKSYKSARFPLSIQGNEKSPMSSSNSCCARNEESCTEGPHYVTIEISGTAADRITEAYNTNKRKSPILQNPGGFVNHAFEEGETANGLYFLRPRSVSLPNLLLYPWHMNQWPKSTAQSRLNHQVLRTKCLNVNQQLPNPMLKYQRTDGGFDLVLTPERCDVSSSSSSASSNRRYYKNCRRHLCSNSNSSNSSGNLCVNKGLYSEGGIQSTKNRKHLPNPFNKINHRFHSTLHCPCFLFFCFLCCYPAVYLMQRSDIQFISGDDDLARTNGKRATVFYVVGGVTAVAFLSIFLFCMYFFLGDSLIKTKDS